ncbi:MAG: sensor histidine kinase [Alphaproteobacteria bacterium]|nr:MAG: sensor histidine kinase [Alphaproteobacteria bacterium]
MMERGEKNLLRSSLSSRLLLLTICFVMVVEVLVWVPSVANFRRNFLEQRMTAAEIAVLALLEAPHQSVSRSLEAQLLETAGVKAVSLQRSDRSRLMLRGDAPTHIDASYDLRVDDPFTMMQETFATLLRGGRGVVRVVAIPANGIGEEIAIILEEQRLFDEMLRYSRNVLLLSIIISTVTAGLVFLSIHRMLVRPMRRITRSMVEFSRHPADPERILVPSGRSDEIGIAERELARMQEELRHALNQRSRLANLGTAVSKVNHDLRNILATAHLSSDRLLAEGDARTRELSQRLIGAIDRAIDLCERTLKYGRADEPPPNKRDFDLQALVEDVRLSLGLDDAGDGVEFVNAVPEAYVLHADPDHMFRVLLNLGRNALAALRGRNGRITVHAETRDGCCFVSVSDTGPGVPERVRRNLFQPFAGGSGGTGLGLAIVADLVDANGGKVTLEKSDEAGSTFVIEIPESPNRRPAGA